jgi:FlaA1/EpsC-like NDP-sugar epimerase
VLGDRLSENTIRFLWRIERVLVVVFISLIIVIVSLGVLLILSKDIRYYFAWYFMITSVISYIMTDYVTVRFERAGNKWKNYKKLRFGFFFLGIVASSEVAAFLSVGYGKALNSPEIGLVVFILTIVAIALPYFYFDWKDKVKDSQTSQREPIKA